MSEIDRTELIDKIQYYN